MSESEYIERVAKLAGIQLPDECAEDHIKFSYSVHAPVWQAVEWLKEYLVMTSN